MNINNITDYRKLAKNSYTAYQINDQGEVYQEGCMARFWRRISRDPVNNQYSKSVKDTKIKFHNAVLKAEGEAYANAAMEKVFGEDWRNDGKTLLKGHRIKKVLNETSRLRMTAIKNNQKNAQIFFNKHTKNLNQLKNETSRKWEQQLHLKVSRDPNYYTETFNDDKLNEIFEESAKACAKKFLRNFEYKHPGFSEIAKIYSLTDLDDLTAQFKESKLDDYEFIEMIRQAILKEIDNDELKKKFKVDEIKEGIVEIFEKLVSLIPATSTPKINSAKDFVEQRDIASSHHGGFKRSFSYFF